MTTTEDNLHLIFDNSVTTWCLKLMNGDSIIGKTMDDPEQLNSVGYITMTCIMSLKKQLAMNPASGEITDILLILPWQEGVDIFYPLVIPADAIITIAPAVRKMEARYDNFLIGYIASENKELVPMLREKMGLNPVTEGNPEEEDHPKDPTVLPTTVAKNESAFEKEDQTLQTTILPYQVDGVTRH